MSKAWPNVRLGDVLRRSEETIQVQPDISYRQITVKLWGKGVVLRGILTGAEIAASRQIVARRGQFILSRIDARNGALGIVPDELNEAIVSNDFPVFDVAVDRLLPAYLGWMCKTESFVDECKRASEGTTNRVRLQEKSFLVREIPLPPPAEQRRIVARIEALAAQIDEARVFRLRAYEESEALLASALEDIFPKKHQRKFDYQLVRDAISGHKQGYYASGKSLEGEVHFARITDITDVGYLDYRGMPRIKVDDPTLKTFRVCPGDFLFARTGGAGRFGLATEPCDCIFASYLIRFTFKHDYLPAFLRFYMRSPRFQNGIRSRIHGGANQNIHAEDIKEATVPVISLAEQHRIVAELDALQAEVDAVKRLQAETAAELDALLPAILDRAFKGGL